MRILSQKQKSQKSMSKENTKKNTPAGIIVRMLKTKDKGEKRNMVFHKTRMKTHFLLE